jgi:hypothetical protein
MISERKILSYWIVEKARWDKTTNKFVDYTYEGFTREITMSIDSS